MSKFFARANELSDSDSSDSSEEEKEQVTQAQTQAVAGKRPGAPGVKKQYLKGFDDSEESEEEQRVVKTTKDKRQEVIDNILKDLKNHININDFGAVQADFDRITEEITRTGSTILQGKDEILPNFILRAYLSIDDCINDVTPEQKKKFNKTNSQAYNKIKQKFKKYLQGTGSTNNTYEQQVEAYRKNPVNSEEELKKALKTKQQSQKEEKKVAAETAAIASSTKAKAKPKAKAGSDSEDESESEEEASRSEDADESSETEPEPDDEKESSDEDDDAYNFFNVPREEMTPAQRRLKWVKKDRLPQALQDKLNIKKEQKEGKDGKQQRKERKLEREIEKKEDVNAQKKKEEDEDKQTQLNLRNDYSIDYTKLENVYKKLRELQEERMKGKYSPKYHQNLLTHILTQVKDNKYNIEIILNLLNALFEAGKFGSGAVLLGFLNRENWLAAYNHITTLMGLLDTDQQKELIKNVLIKDKTTAGDFQRRQSEHEEDEDGEEVEQFGIQAGDIERSILPSLASYMEKLDQELFKAYQTTSYQSFEYLQRLRDENLFLFLSDKIQKFLLEFNDQEKVARVAILKLDHLYYKHDSLFAKMKARLAEQSNGNGITQSQTYLVENSQAVLDELYRLVNRGGTLRMKQRATLYLVYHHSIHNRFNEARDLLLKTHIGDTIHLQDIKNQILYNRALTQIGMAAFRLGQIEDCHEILIEVCQHLKLREVLAQGISKMIDKPLELEKEELKRQMPPHMHINLQLLDCIYMISAMLLEIPNIAENQYSVNKRIISKNFKKLIDQYDSKAFYLAPENYRDNIVFAAKQLNKSNWKKAVEHIFSIRLIQKMPEFNNERFQEVLRQRFKESALSAFLCRAAKSYQSFSLQSLTALFEIAENKLTQLLSKMILKNKLQAHLDITNKLLVLDTNNEVNELQQLSLQYVSKMELMIENNERMVDMMNNQQLYGYKERTVAEINALNANKRNKQLTKAGAPIGVGTGATGMSGQPVNLAQGSTQILTTSQAQAQAYQQKGQK